MPIAAALVVLFAFQQFAVAVQVVGEAQAGDEGRESTASSEQLLSIFGDPTTGEARAALGPSALMRKELRLHDAGASASQQEGLQQSDAESLVEASDSRYVPDWGTSDNPAAQKLHHHFQAALADMTPPQDYIWCSEGGASGPEYSDALTFNGAPLPEPPMSLSAMIHSDNLGAFQVFLGWGAGNESWDGAEFRLSAVGNLQYGVHDGFSWHHVEAKPAVNLLDGHWHVVSVVEDPHGGTEIFVNGSRVGFGWIGGSPRVNLTTAKSARKLYAFKDMAFHGNVTQVFIYDRALRDWEVPKVEHVACRESEPTIIHLDLTHTVYKNLAGLGPDFDGAGPDANDTQCKKSLRFTEVGTYGGVDLDLLVMNTSLYEPRDISLVGLFSAGGSVAHININAGTSVDLRFELVSHMTCYPISVDNFYFTFLDIDSGPNGTGLEQVAISSDVVTYYVADDSQLEHTWPSSTSNLMFWATERAIGNASDNPVVGAFDLDDVQEERGMTMIFAGSSGFDATLSATPGVGGRDFSFCGWSSLVLDGFNNSVPQGPPVSKYEQVKNDPEHLATGDGQLAGTWET